MKIAYCSDLHLERYVLRLRGFHETKLYTPGEPLPVRPEAFPKLKNTENADVLVLAGDICNFRQFLNGENDSFFEYVSKEFPEVIWVFGNHEYYNAGLTDSWHKRIVEKIEDEYTNIYATHRGILEYEGVTFLCGTMWTDFDKANSIKMTRCHLGMPDYEFINQTDLCFDNERLTPDHVLSEHRKTVGMFEDYLSSVLENEKSYPIVCVSHHAPSWNSIVPKYIRNELNPAFVSDLDYMATISSNVKYWIHGHTHDKMKYKLTENCTVVCNPHGYIDFDMREDFKLEHFEV